MSAWEEARLPRPDEDRLTAWLHDDPALCAKTSPNGHPKWMGYPICRSIAVRLAAREDEAAADPAGLDVARLAKAMRNVHAPTGLLTDFPAVAAQYAAEYDRLAAPAEPATEGERG